MNMDDWVVWGALISLILLGIVGVICIIVSILSFDERIILAPIVLIMLIFAVIPAIKFALEDLGY